MRAQASIEDRRLLNPAFLAAIVLKAAQGFTKEAGASMPHLYSYLVPPLVLHPETRDRLPTAITTKLIPWAERNGDVLAGFPRRLADLAPATREALFVLATSRLVGLETAGNITPSTGGLKPLQSYEKQAGSIEVVECLRKSYFIGRWLSISGTMATVLSILGVAL